MCVVAFSLTEFNKKIDIIARLFYNNTIIHINLNHLLGINMKPIVTITLSHDNLALALAKAKVPVSFRDLYGHTEYATITYSDYELSVKICCYRAPNSEVTYHYFIGSHFIENSSGTCQNNHNLQSVCDAGIEAAIDAVLKYDDHLNMQIKMQDLCQAWKNIGEILSPAKDKEKHDQQVELLDMLLDRFGEEGSRFQGLIETVGLLVSDYEKAYYPMEVSQ